MVQPNGCIPCKGVTDVLLAQAFDYRTAHQDDSLTYQQFTAHEYHRATTFDDLRPTLDQISQKGRCGEFIATANGNDALAFATISTETKRVIRQRH